MSIHQNLLRKQTFPNNTHYYKFGNLRVEALDRPLIPHSELRIPNWTNYIIFIALLKSQYKQIVNYFLVIINIIFKAFFHGKILFFKWIICWNIWLIATFLRQYCLYYLQKRNFWLAVLQFLYIHLILISHFYQWFINTILLFI